MFRHRVRPPTPPLDEAPPSGSSTARRSTTSPTRPAGRSDAPRDRWPGPPTPDELQGASSGRRRVRGRARRRQPPRIARRPGRSRCSAVTAALARRRPPARRSPRPRARSPSRCRPSPTTPSASSGSRCPASTPRAPRHRHPTAASRSTVIPRSASSDGQSGRPRRPRPSSTGVALGRRRRATRRRHRTPVTGATTRPTEPDGNDGRGPTDTERRRRRKDADANGNRTAEEARAASAEHGDSGAQACSPRATSKGPRTARRVPAGRGQEIARREEPEVARETSGWSGRSSQPTGAGDHSHASSRSSTAVMRPNATQSPMHTVSSKISRSLN